MSPARNLCDEMLQYIKHSKKVSKAHIPPAVVTRGHTTLREKKTNCRKRYTSSQQLIPWRSTVSFYKCRTSKNLLVYICLKFNKILKQSSKILRIGVTDGKTNKVQKEDKSKPQHLNLVFSNRFGHSEHACEI